MTWRAWFQNMFCLAIFHTKPWASSCVIRISSSKLEAFAKNSTEILSEARNFNDQLTKQKDTHKIKTK